VFATNNEAAVAGEPVDFLRKPHLCVDMLDRTDTEAIEEAIAITDGFAHYAGLEWGSRGTAHADYRRQKAEKVKEAAEAEAETEADAEGAVAMEYAGMRWVVVPKRCLTLKAHVSAFTFAYSRCPVLNLCCPASSRVVLRSNSFAAAVCCCLLIRILLPIVN